MVAEEEHQLLEDLVFDDLGEEGLNIFQHTLHLADQVENGPWLLAVGEDRGEEGPHKEIQILLQPETLR